MPNRRPSPSVLALVALASLAACGGAAGTAEAPTPDGSLVFYSRYGAGEAEADLWVTGAEGTPPVALAVTAADEIFAAVTPGGRVIYTLEPFGVGDLRSVRTDGSDPRVLTSGPGLERFVALAPGGRVVYERDAGGDVDLYVVGEDGAGDTLLAGEAGVHEQFLAVVGDRAVYLHTDRNFDRDLYSVNLDGTGALALAAQAGDESLLAVLPDARLVYGLGVGGANELHLVPAAGGGAVPLWVEPGVEKTVVGSGPGYAVVSGVADGAVQSDLYVIPLAGGAPVAIGASADSEIFGGVTSTGWIVYHRFTASAGVDLRASRPDGTGDHPVADTAADELLEGIADDGRLIVWRRQAGSSWDLLAVDPGSGSEVALAAGPTNEKLQGLHGTRAVYSVERGGPSELRAVSLDGTWDVALVPTAPLPPQVAFQGITPGGRVLYSTRPGGYDLSSVRLDGTGTIPLGATSDAVFLAGVGR